MINNVAGRKDTLSYKNPIFPFGSHDMNLELLTHNFIFAFTLAKHMTSAVNRSVQKKVFKFLGGKCSS